MKILICIAVILIIAFIVILFAINEYIKMSTAKKICKTTDKITKDCILVFGCGVKKDGTPSNMLYDRIKRGAELYNHGVARKVLMSGSRRGDDYDEVSVMTKYAVEMGVAEEDIILDYAGVSTYESIYRLQGMYGFKNAVLVTQKYHLYRALFLADGLGVDALGVAADYREYLSQKKQNRGEFLARCKAFLIWIIKLNGKRINNKVLEKNNKI